MKKWNGISPSNFPYRQVFAHSRFFPEFAPLNGLIFPRYAAATLRKAILRFVSNALIFNEYM